MLGEPIISVDKFSGSGEGGIFYNEGFVPDKENGKSLLKEGFGSYKSFDNSDTNFGLTDKVLGNVQAISYVLSLKGGNVYKLVMDQLGQFFIKNFFGLAFHEGYAGKTPISSPYAPVQKPDIYQMSSGNLIYTNNVAVGLIIRGNVKTGSSTTTIIDSAGRNFTTLGVTTADFVTNIVTGAVYPITAIGNGDATNDKLTFTAIGANANTADDEFLVVVHQKFDSTTGVTFPLFIGQPDRAYWSRQIKQFGDNYYILNGGYISKLLADETTWAANHKKLPTGFQATCFDTNTDRMLIAVRSISQGFRLLLWDGYSDGYNNILEIEGEINCLKNYSNGWIFILNSTLYFTDGYQLQELQSYADKGLLQFTSIQPRNFNGIEVLNETVYTYSDSDDFNRATPGVYIWNKKFGWIFSPALFKSRLFGIPTGIFVSNYATSSNSYIQSGIDIGLQGGCSVLRDNMAYTANYMEKSIIYFIKLPRKVQVKQIGLNLSANFALYGDKSSGDTTKVTVNVGQGKGSLFSYNILTAVLSTTSISVDGRYRTGEVGDQVRFYKDALVGERTRIMSIADKGTAAEIWTVSPALSGSYGSLIGAKIIKTRATNPLSRTINLENLDDPVLFDVNSGFISNKLFVEIIVSGVTKAAPISINSIDIY